MTNEAKLVLKLALAWKPKQILNAWRWAEEHLVLPSTVTPFPGPFNTDLMPYVRKPLEEWGDGKCSILTLCWSAQSGKTTSEIIALFYDLVFGTFNSMMVMPTEEMVRAFVSERIEPIIEANPMLKELIKKGRSDNKALVKKLNDGKILNFAWSNSATQLSSRTVGQILFDEVDKYPAKVNREADPISLGMERMKLIPNNKAFITSTVTVKENFVYRYYESGSQSHFYVPCVKCGYRFCLEWELVKFDNQENLSIDEIGDTAYIECPKCKGKIDDNDKKEMVTKGEWVDHNLRASPSNRSYRINEIYSPITPLKKLVAKFLEADYEYKEYNRIEKLQNFLNSSLAVPFEDDMNQANSIESIKATRDLRARGIVPIKKGMCGLIAGIDTQNNGFFAVVRAFDSSMSSWLVWEGFLRDLEEVAHLLFRTVFFDDDGREYRVLYSFIDSGGHRTREIYDFVGMHKGSIWAIQGKGNISRSYSVADVEHYPASSEILKTGIKLILLEVNVYKGMLHRSINKQRESYFQEGGVFYTHKQIKDNYIKQMIVEFIEEKKWVCPQGLANHYWDCEVYCLACADFVKINYQTLDKTVTPYRPDEDEDRGQGLLGLD